MQQKMLSLQDLDVSINNPQAFYSSYILSGDSSDADKNTKIMNTGDLLLSNLTQSKVLKYALLRGISYEEASSDYESKVLNGMTRNLKWESDEQITLKMARNYTGIEDLKYKELGSLGLNTAKDMRGIPYESLLASGVNLANWKNLSRAQKGFGIAQAGVAGVDTALTASGITNIWNPLGWAFLIASAGIGIASILTK